MNQIPTLPIFCPGIGPQIWLRILSTTLPRFSLGIQNLQYIRLIWFWLYIFIWVPEPILESSYTIYDLGLWDLDRYVTMSRASRKSTSNLAFDARLFYPWLLMMTSQTNRERWGTTVQNQGFNQALIDAKQQFMIQKRFLSPYFSGGKVRHSLLDWSNWWDPDVSGSVFPGSKSSISSRLPWVEISQISPQDTFARSFFSLATVLKPWNT